MVALIPVRISFLVVMMEIKDGLRFLKSKYTYLQKIYWPQCPVGQ